MANKVDTHAEKKPSASRWECANCSLPEQPGVTLRPCSRCKLVRYCGTECQAQHWKKGGHKQHCVSPENRKPQPAAKDNGAGPTCAICMDNMAGKDSQQLLCSHVFHVLCLDGLRSTSATALCPVCRSSLTSVPVKPSPQLDVKAGAERELRESIRLNPSSALAHCCLGSVLRLNGDSAGAENMLRKSISLDPRIAVAHFDLGAVLYDKGDVEEAEKELRKAIELDPSIFIPHFVLHLVLLERGDLVGAEKALREALRIDPADAEAIASLEQIMETKKKLKKSKAK